ncbi:hypothetical protein D3C73_1655900 [compost metagenome]
MGSAVGEIEVGRDDSAIGRQRTTGRLQKSLQLLHADRVIVLGAIGHALDATACGG